METASSQIHPFKPYRKPSLSEIADEFSPRFIVVKPLVLTISIVGH
jgi:hypothetical protein